MEHDYDAVVIGGGPAGSLAAMHLAEAGWRTLLIERRAAMQRKTCGHCLSARAMSILESIDLREIVEQRAPGRVGALILHDVSGRSSTIALASATQPAGLLVERSWFDELLRMRAQRAGARILQPATAHVDRIQRNGVVISIRSNMSMSVLSTSLVIGADGLGSCTSRSLGMCMRTKQGRKFGFSITIDSGCDADLECGAVHMFVVPGGYLGLVRLDDGRLHAAALIGPTAAQRNPAHFVKQVSLIHPQVHHTRIEDALCDGAAVTAVGPMPHRTRCVANRWGALVGDAAGYAEPFTGEGMTWAMESAQLLGQVIQPLAPAPGIKLGTWSTDSAMQYERLWRNGVARRQQLCCAAARVMERPALLAMLNRTVLQLPAMKRCLARRVTAA